MGGKRVLVEVETRLWAQVRRRARQEGRTIREIVGDALRMYRVPHVSQRSVTPKAEPPTEAVSTPSEDDELGC